MDRCYRVIVIGGGHAGVEAAWAAANVLGGTGTVALVTLDPTKIGVMSCNPAIGGLAKGQIVREIDALNGLMGLATDATGIQFRVLNASKGPAVHGPRAQCDKHAYAAQVQRLIASRPEIVVIGAAAERLLVESRRVRGVVLGGAGGGLVRAPAVVLTTGTFMRGLMHTGEARTPGGRFGEAPAHGISGALCELGFELGRLKTGTPPRLSRKTIDWVGLPEQAGDTEPVPFSDLTEPAAFPALEQVACRVTETNGGIHETIRANLHRAPMYSGQIESVGPRYCPSIEDKVVRFAERSSHHVFLEPESLHPDHADWVYANGISTSLPPDVQGRVVRGMRGCEHAEILRYGYAVEYDMVRPHQIMPTGMTKSVEGLYLAGQINGTSGYEEAAGQGLLAGLNAARAALGEDAITLGRHEAYIGVMLDDLCTKTPLEPYRMFTSRAEHRLALRSDNAADRLTPVADRAGLLRHGPTAALRRAGFAARTASRARIEAAIDRARVRGLAVREALRRPDFTVADLAGALSLPSEGDRRPNSPLFTAHAEAFYAAFIARSQREAAALEAMERRPIPPCFDYTLAANLRAEARQALQRFRPATLGMASRLEGLTPADVSLLAVLIDRA